ncbi:Alpha/beta hydrolase domain-containing protein 11 [Polyrhizophydium stewartii]|uniref:Alpha/beta hydrolase domain-containing protein 11 n=1 Tax=Polyrhizophydium stewartii TaxID=2732419 RepID=A0ABR4N9Q5_9FUNG
MSSTARTGRVATGDGAAIAFALHGSPSASPPVIVVPDLLQVKEDLAATAAALAGDRLVCAVDLRGMGESAQCPPMPPATEPPEITLMQLATDVFDVVLHVLAGNPDRPAAGRFVVMGFGLGGLVAQYLALLMRGRDDLALDKLVVVASAPMTPSRGSLVNSAMQILASQKAGMRPAAFGPDKSLANSWVFGNLSPQFSAKHAELAARLVADLLAHNRSRNIAEEQVFAMQGVNLTDQLGLLRVPTLVIHGSQDTMIDPWYASMFSEVVGNAKVVLVDGAGHWVHIMEPDRVLCELQDFLAN